MPELPDKATLQRWAAEYRREEAALNGRADQLAAMVTRETELRQAAAEAGVKAAELEADAEEVTT